METQLQNRGLSETTRHHYHAFFSQALNQAVKWGQIARNVSNAAYTPPLRAVEREPPPTGDIYRLFDSVSDSRPDLAAFIVVAAITGCRRGELCALRWQDVDLSRGMMTVRASISDMPARLGGPVEKDTKTHRVRTVALDLRAAAELVRVEQRARAQCLQAEVALTPDCFVWSQDVDRLTPWRPNRVTMSFIAARRRAGLDHIQLKDLRHWAATHLVASGVDIKTIAGRLGHSPQVLLKTYAHRLPARDEQGAAILGDLLSTTQTSDEHHLT